MSISLNDHEQRIKNIDGQLPSINDRIGKLETSQSKIYKFDLKSIPKLYYDRNSRVNLSGYLPFTITSNMFIANSDINIYSHDYGRVAAKFSPGPLKKQPYSLKSSVMNTSAGDHYCYMTVSDNKLYMQNGHGGDYSFTSGYLYFIESDKL